MRWILAGLLALVCGTTAVAQSYEYVDSILDYRKNYIQELIVDARAPIKSAQAKNLDFFKPDEAYRVWASFVETPGSVPFKIETHSGKQKPYREYGVLSFTLNGKALKLHIYQSLDLIKEAAYKNHLFIPFRDETNYETTYAGGRYIDLTTDDLKGGGYLLDFNKCYNPYCAYADGYSCPIPPAENSLQVEIRAGEKIFIQ
ncbi:MAG: DUF1684 domain-containing protein [Bacteroidota bacterium]